ncbi:MAG: hypothetical protein ACOZAL_00885, partial [Patescibacteria group bacterium]
KLGDWVQLGNGVQLGDKLTDKKIAQCFLDEWKQFKTILFTKWVTKERMSPNFDGGTCIEYKKGEIIKCNADPDITKQCAEGLHILRLGHRPEWYGLCKPNHNLIPLTVQVNSEDIVFGGFLETSMFGKIRVKKLKVLD